MGFFEVGGLGPDLESDVSCAASVVAPVLISAEADLAEWVAHVIHARSGRREETFLVYRPGRGRQLGLLNSLLGRSAPSGGTLFIEEVNKAGKEVQQLLQRSLETQSTFGRPFRIIAGTSVWLYELVERGEFDKSLFYHLNELHICADRQRAVMNVAAFRKHRHMLRAGFLAHGPLRASAARQGQR